MANQPIDTVKEGVLIQALIASLIAVGLIGAAMMGKLDVRGWLGFAPPPPQSRLLLYGEMRGGVEREDWPTALDRARRLLKDDPENSEAWHTAALARLKMGDVSGAKVAYEALYLRDPKDVTAMLGLAASERLLGNDRAARRLATDAMLSKYASQSQRDMGNALLNSIDAVEREFADAPPLAPKVPLSPTPISPNPVGSKVPDRVQ